MEPKIVCHINLGQLFQDIYVIETKEKVQKYSIKLDELPCFLASRKNIFNIEMHGNKNFCLKIEKDTNELQQKLYFTKNKKFFYN